MSGQQGSNEDSHYGYSDTSRTSGWGNPSSGSGFGGDGRQYAPLP